MLWLSFTEAALLDWLYGLPQWQRERVAETLVALLSEPRPPAAQPLTPNDADPGESYQISIADTVVAYKVYKNDNNEDYLVVVHRV